MDNQNILNALNDSHLVTVGGLNKVYRYVMSRIKISGASGSAVYKVQGSQYWDTLIKLDFLTGEDAKEGIIEGRIYNVLDADPEGITGANYVCLRQYRYNSTTQYYEVITYVLSSDTEYDSEKIYYIKEGDNYKVVPNPQPTDNPHDKGWYEQTWTNQIETSTDTFIQVTKSNISQNWSIFWDSFGGSQPLADKEGQLGIVTIGNNINVINGSISVNTANGTDTLGLVKQGNYVTISSGIISANVANGDTPGVVKQGTNTSITSDGKVNVANANGASTLGVVKQGDYVTITDGKISANVANGDTKGVVYQGDNVTIADGKVSVAIAKSTSNLGLVKKGDNINIGDDGTISVSNANGTSTLGVVKQGTNVTISDGVVSVATGGANLGLAKSGTATKLEAGAVNVVYDNTTLSVDDNNQLYVKTATNDAKGIVIADNATIVNTSGTLSARNASGSTSGIVYQGDYVTISDGKISANKASGTTPGVVYQGDNTTIASDGKISVTKLVNSSTSNTTTIIDVANNGTAPVVKITGKKNTDDTAPVSSTSALYVDGNILAEGNISGHKVFHAVWNDISDAIEVQDSLEIEAGRCYRFDGTEYSKTSEYCQKGIIGIHSDTAGDILGRKGKHKELDISVGGFVLAYVDRQYESGTPLTSGPNGTLTEMKREDVREYPERLVATYWKPETETEWGSDMYKVTVNGRHWVKIK